MHFARRAFLFVFILMGAFTASAAEVRCLDLFSKASDSLSLEPIFMQKSYEGEAALGKVRYFTARERAEHEWIIQDGLLTHAHNGRRVTTSWNENDKLIEFVISPQGRIYGATALDRQATLDRKQVLHHSTFLSGAPVGFAGSLRVVTGHPVMIDNRSGHYLTSPGALIQTVKFLKSKGLDTRLLVIKFIRLPRLEELTPELHADLLEIMPEYPLIVEAYRVAAQASQSVSTGDAFTNDFPPVKAQLLTAAREQIATEVATHGHSRLLQRLILNLARLYPPEMKAFVDELAKKYNEPMEPL